MANILHPAAAFTRRLTQIKQPSLLSRFLTWSGNQQEDRFMWLGIALAGHGCVITPVAIFFIVMGGLSLPLFMIALTSMAMVVVTNLAALPTRITIPVLFLSVVVDVAILLYLLATAL
ncbi:MAG: hypothetical protein JNK79_12925 [Chitinophagaceae bacterium]|nr:hypothetical protein [Chitinophagaceae bacterium]